MQARRYLAIPALVALLAVGVAAASGGSGSGSPTRSAVPVDPTAEAGRYRDVNAWNVGAWVNGANARAFEVYLDAVHANEEAEAAQRQAGPRATGGGGGGACRAPADTGAPPPAGFPESSIQRESGGSTTASNGTHEGRAQLADSHFCGGGCTGMSYAACWDKLWAGGAGRSNWVQTMP